MIFPGIKHPVARLKEFVRSDDAHRHDRHAEFLREIENPFLERLHVAIARARSFGKRDQADSGIERRFRAPRHFLKSRPARRVRHGNVPEASHHPAVNGNLEMRFQLESAHELRNRRINHEGIENIHVIADENARPLRIESRRALHFEFHAGKPQNIAKENALRPVVLARIDEHPQEERGTCKPRRNEFR